MVHREETHCAERRSEHIYHPGLLCIYPFLGFAWSGFKTRASGPLGFEPRAITAASTLAEVCLFALEGIFVFYFGSGFIALFCGKHFYEQGLWLDPTLLVILPLDAAVRYSQVIRGDESPDGFLEWLFGMFRRKSDN